MARQVVERHILCEFCFAVACKYRSNALLALASRSINQSINRSPSFLPSFLPSFHPSFLPPSLSLPSFLSQDCHPARSRYHPPPIPLFNFLLRAPRQHLHRPPQLTTTMPNPRKRRRDYHNRWPHITKRRYIIHRASRGAA
jgi:hypothetical protein